MMIEYFGQINLLAAREAFHRNMAWKGNGDGSRSYPLKLRLEPRFQQVLHGEVMLEARLDAFQALRDSCRKLRIRVEQLGPQCGGSEKLIGRAHGDNPKLELFGLIGVQACLERRIGF